MVNVHIILFISMILIVFFRIYLWSEIKKNFDKDNNYPNFFYVLSARTLFGFMPKIELKGKNISYRKIFNTLGLILIVFFLAYFLSIFII